LIISLKDLSHAEERRKLAKLSHEKKKMEKELEEAKRENVGLREKMELLSREKERNGERRLKESRHEVEKVKKEYEKRIEVLNESKESYKQVMNWKFFLLN